MKKIISLILALIMVLGMAVPAMAAEAPEGYTTDSNEIMAYELWDNSSIYGFSAFSGTYMTVFSIYGYYNDDWKQTTCSQDGFATVVRIYGENDTYKDYPVKLDELDGTGKCIINDGTKNIISVSFWLEFTNSGKTLQINYEVENLSGAEVRYSIGSGGDIQIGENDSAPIFVMKETVDGAEKVIGFKMLEKADGTGAQFNFFGGNRTGVTPVDGFWYGEYSEVYGSYTKNLFTDKTEKEDLTGEDSGCAWHWNGTLAADATETDKYSVAIGIGGEGSENVGGNYTMSTDTKITLNQNEGGNIINDFTDAVFIVKVGDTVFTEGENGDFVVEDRNTASPKIKFTTAGIAKLGNSAQIEIVATMDDGQTISGTVNYKPVYNVTVRTPDNGTASADKTTAAAGETVTINATPDNGYELDRIDVLTANNARPIGVTDGKFTMPAEDVTVDVTFKEVVTATTYTVTFVDCGETVSVQTVEDIAELVVPEEKGKLFYKFEGWYDEEGYKLDENYELTGDPIFTAKYSFKHTYNRPSDVVEEKPEDVAEANPSTGAPVFAPAVIVLSAVASFLGKRK